MEDYIVLNKKWTMYIIHHSHTDIGYTDLQEKIIFKQIDYIRTAVEAIKEGYNSGAIDKDFKWNCETYYCVEKFLEEATEDEKQDLYSMIKSNNIGLSATYLNFTDLVDKTALNRRRNRVPIYKYSYTSWYVSSLSEPKAFLLGR
jgi:hypothetical protein